MPLIRASLLPAPLEAPGGLSVSKKLAESGRGCSVQRLVDLCLGSFTRKQAEKLSQNVLGQPVGAVV